MPAATPAKAFKKRAVTRKDGVAVLTRPLITVAALEAGYTLPSPMVDEEVEKTTYRGQMTQEEFMELCRNNAGRRVTPQATATAVLMVAPNNEITRASLEEILAHSNDDLDLTDEEIDLLFETLDTKHSSKITGEDLMVALHGSDGLEALEEERMLMIREGATKCAQDDAQRRENERLAREKAEREEQERLAREQAEREEAERLAREKAEREEAERQARERERQKAEKDKAARDAAAREAAAREAAARDAAAKEKASGCC